MRIAAFRRNGKLLGQFVSLAEASRLLDIDKVQIAAVITGKCKTAWALEGPKRRLGSLVFREIDNSQTGVS